MNRGLKGVAVEVENVPVGLKLGPNMDSAAPIRRSSRKKEDKSYVEIPDSMLEITESKGHTNGPLSFKELTGYGQNNTGGGATVLSNGDVEMESEDDDDEDLPLLPLPKVRKLKMLMRS